MVEKISSHASISARAVCLCRALESTQPSGSRQLLDVFAKYFLTEIERLTLRSVANWGTRWIEIASQGLYQEVIRRHATTDSWLEEALGSGIQNLIILGAGYDSRGWRFARPGLRTIELDQAATQTHKRQCLKRFVTKFPEAQVELSPVDFRFSSWPDVLPSFTQSSVVIWEGVTMYLSREEVIATAHTLAGKLGRGTEVIVDVLLPNAPMRGTSSPTRLGLGVLGEKLKWFLPLHEAPSFFEPLGFKVSQLLELGDQPTGPSHIGLIRLSRL
ncbi:MAG: SAM-dependent methyltransferase [Myxococcales bacterium]|nr:SAM-dependent methyltransferase [Myxococcales bacterium]